MLYPDFSQEYITDRSMQLQIPACITTLLCNDAATCHMYVSMVTLDYIFQCNPHY